MAAHIGPVSQHRSLQQRDTCVFAPARRHPCRAQTPRPRCVKHFAAPKDEAAESQPITDASEDIGSDGESRRWASTTIVENRAASVDGQLRTLLLSVEDHVRYIDGRKIRHRQENPRWIDAYSLPGQQIEVRFPEQPAVSGEDGKPSAAGDESSASEDVGGQEQQQAFAISSSPYAARRDSAWLDASIVEILTERNGDSFNDKLCSLKPGSVIEVSEVQGRGFSPLFNSDAELLSALEEGHSLLLIAYGTRGIAPLRACLEWAPIQAHCTAHTVSLIYVAASNTQAAYLQDWDNWRQSGVNLHPVYADAGSAGNGSVPLDDLQEDMAMELLAQGLGLGQDGAEGVLGVSAEDVTVLVAGAPRKLAASLSRKLMQKGILMEHIENDMNNAAASAVGMPWSGP